MSEKVLMRGVPQSVCYMRDGCVELLINDTSGHRAIIEVPRTEADKAREAMDAVPPKAVEVISGAGGAGGWQARTVRCVPDVVCMLRGKLIDVSISGIVKIQVVDTYLVYSALVTNWRDAASALAVEAEVEICSVDGGHGGRNIVRRVEK